MSLTKEPTLTLPVSIIIPCHSVQLLLTLLPEIAKSSCLPKQLIIVDSALVNLSLLEVPSNLTQSIQIVCPPETLFPGAARNFGLTFVTQPFCSFLDVATIPPTHWLATAYQILTSFDDIDYVSGSTRYIASNYIQTLLIAATYGFFPLSTVPGSIFRTKSLLHVGLFFPNIRAGEDTEWLLRLRNIGLLRSRFSSPSLSYTSVPSTINQLISKWHRNYSSCSDVVYHLEAQKLIYSLFLCTLIIYIAFSWNAIFARWVESNTLYISNITKIAFTSLLSFYAFFRGIYLPFRKGVPLSFLLPFNWTLISAISMMIDITKFNAFFIRKHDNL